MRRQIVGENEKNSLAKDMNENNTAVGILTKEEPYEHEEEAKKSITERTSRKILKWLQGTSRLIDQSRWVNYQASLRFQTE